MSVETLITDHRSHQTSSAVEGESPQNRRIIMNQYLQHVEIKCAVF